MWETLADYNDLNNAPLSNEKLRQAVGKFMAETEEEERNANNVTMDTFCHQSPVTTNTRGEISNVKNERQISLDILAETIKGFNGLAVQSTINDSTYYNSEEDDAEINPNSDPKVATHTSDRKNRKFTDTNITNGNSPHKLLINRLIPEIIPFFILPIDQTTAGGVAASGGTLHACRTTLSKEIVADAACSAARVFKYPPVVNWINTDGTILRYGKTFGMPPRLTNPVRIGDGPSFSPTRVGIQDIGSPGGSIGPQEFRDAQPLDTLNNGIYSKHMDPVPT